MNLLKGNPTLSSRGLSVNWLFKIAHSHNALFQEVEKLEKEVLDMVGKNTDLERMVARQQKELDQMEDMQKKVLNDQKSN